MKIKKHIPNFITCLNLFSGCIACVMAFNGDFFWAMIFICLSAIFDFLDGLAARVLKAYSEMGKQLDSLADMVSFGVAPGMVMLSLLATHSSFYNPTYLGFYIPFIAFIAFVIPVFSALRLAKFNIDDRQTDSFIGLPTPANALFWASFACFLPERFEGNGIAIIVLIFLFSYLLVSNLPMFSLKFTNLKWKDNAVRYIFLALSLTILIAGFALFGSIFALLYLVIVLFVLMSAVMMFACKK